MDKRLYKFIKRMFAIESNCGGVLVNIDNLNKDGIWRGYRGPLENVNISVEQFDDIMDFIFRYGIGRVIKRDRCCKSLITQKLLTNLKKSYIFVRPYNRFTNRYYMKEPNCTGYDVKQGRKEGFYMMGIVILKDDIEDIKENQSVIIDWIESYYPNTNTAFKMIGAIEKSFKVKLIPANIGPNHKFWKKYLSKYCNINTFEDFIKYLWDISGSYKKYYENAYNIEGYYKAYDMSCEDMYLRLLYDY